MSVHSSGVYKQKYKKILMYVRDINCFLCFFLPLWDNMGEYDTEKGDKLNNLPY